jgi:hypothetical protein
MSKEMLGEFIFADIYCKGGMAMLAGEIVEVREKAIRIHYEIVPIFAQGYMKPIYDRGAWIPKSIVKETFFDNSDISAGWEIPSWFVNKHMKGYFIKKTEGA